MEPYKAKNEWNACFCSKKHYYSAIDAQATLLANVANLKAGIVKIDNDNFINTVLIDNSSAAGSEMNLVVAHGFGAGLGFFFKNLPSLQQQLPGYKVWLIDWLGMANSSRPSFPDWNKHLSEIENVKVSERFFTDSLEKWRTKVGIEKMVLAGHRYVMM